MKNTIIILVAMALTFCSCNNSNNGNRQNDNNDKTEQTQTEILPIEEEVLFATGDLNYDGISDSVVIARKEVYRNLDEGVEPVKGDGLKIFFGDEKGGYQLFGNYAINNHPDEFLSDWDSITIFDDGFMTIVNHFHTDDDNYYTYGIWFLDNDFYLTDFMMEFGTDDDNTLYYDLVNQTLYSDIDWHEIDTEIYHHRSDTYELKDFPLKRLSEFKIGDEVCSFDEYVAHIDEDIFEVSGKNKEELCPAEYEPNFEEGDLNRDGIDDLVVNVNNSRFAVYFKNSDGDYYNIFQGKSFDDWTEISAYVNDGNLMVYAFTESSKIYEFHYDDNGYFHLISFDQSMYWPDGGGSYYQFIDFVNGKRTVQEDENPETVYDIPRIPLRVIEEFHFGNLREIEALYED